MGTRVEVLDNPLMCNRVLIADDHSGFRRAATELMTAEGFEVLGCAVDGRSALQMTADLRPDLLLLDVQLPDMSGFEVARRLAAANDPTAIVLISSRDRSDYGGELEISPVNGFITKSDLSGSLIARMLRCA
jgi:DNA-binding NarL/FixJ family response regulator